MMKPACHHMPGNRDAMPRAGARGMTRAMCLDARSASDAGTLSPGRSDQQLSFIVTASKFIYATPIPKFFTGLQSVNRLNIILIYVYCGLPIVSCSGLLLSCRPWKIINMICSYNVANVLQLKKTCSFHFFPTLSVVIYSVLRCLWCPAVFKQTRRHDRLEWTTDLRSCCKQSVSFLQETEDISGLYTLLLLIQTSRICNVASTSVPYPWFYGAVNHPSTIWSLVFVSKKKLEAAYIRPKGHTYLNRTFNSFASATYQTSIPKKSSKRHISLVRLI